MSLSPDPSSNSENQQNATPSGEDTDIKTRAIAVELNKEIVPADQHHTTNVSPGDQLEVVTLVGGG